MKVSQSATNGNEPEPQVDYSELQEARAQIVYWRRNYESVVKVLMERTDDPALAWLDEIVHTRFSKLL